MRRLLAAASVLFLLCTAGACAERGKLVIITLGGVSLSDILSPGLPNIGSLVDQGAVGVMNVRSGSSPSIVEESLGRYPVEGTCATIGAGTRAASTSIGGEAFSIRESVDGRPVREVFRSLYDTDPGSAEVVHLGSNYLKFINKSAKYPLSIGALGSALRGNGVKTAVIGNSDIPQRRSRAASLIAADADGIIDYGDVSSRMLRKSPTSPYGVTTNQDRLISKFRRAARLSDFIVVDIGDTSRATNYAERCLDTQAALLQSSALSNADRMIGSMLKELNLSRDMVIVLSPNPSKAAMDKFDFLPPVIVTGAGTRKGLLYSNSTRTPGILAVADVSATVLDYFSIPQPNSFVGRPVMVSRGSVEDLSEQNNALILQMERQPIMRALASFLLGCVVTISAAVLLSRHRSVWLSWAALVPASLILAVLWLPAVVDTGLPGTVAALILVCILILAAARAVIRTPSRTLGWICWSMIVTVIIDAFGSQTLLSGSIMSYTPVNGSRYYGIGNEHMGSIIAATMIAAGMLGSMLRDFPKLRMIFLGAILAVLVAVIGLPSLGANVGGAMSAAVAAAFGIVLWRERKIDRKFLAAAIIAVPLALGMMLVFDSLSSSESQSHLGRAAQLVASGGIGEAIAIIDRKMSMNLTLLAYSPWSRLLIGSALAVLAALLVPRLDVLGKLRADRSVHVGIITAAIGALAALLLNDSGVVAAATAFIYVWTAILITALSAPKTQQRQDC